MTSAGLHLSGRQQQLLSLLTEGKSNKEIAFELKITEGSVKQQLFALYRKLGVTSRTKAIVRATELAGSAQPADGDKQEKTYLWKLLTTVAVLPINEPSKRPADIAAFDRALTGLRAQIEHLAVMLDCHLLLAPGGGLLACFGTPLSHLDDPARALSFARLTAQWHKRHGLPGLEIGIGVATAAEIVPESTKPPIRAESFKLAQRLAADCNNGEILTSEICCRLAGPIYPYLPAPDKATSPLGIRMLPSDQEADVAKLAKRNPLPFIDEIIDRCRQGRQSEWLSIESWPPSAGVRLMDAVAAHLEAAKLPVVRLRLPTGKHASELAANAALQIDNFIGTGNGTPKPTPARSPLDALKTLATHGPHAVFIYGVNSLARLMEALELHGMQALSSLPLLLVGMRIHEDADAYVAARMLGRDPVAAGSSRVFKLSLGAKPIAPNQLDADLMTLVDILSAPARQVVRQLAETGEVSFDTAGNHVRELLSSGLFTEQDSSIKCRDEETRRALFDHLVRDFKTT